MCSPCAYSRWPHEQAGPTGSLGNRAGPSHLRAICRGRVQPEIPPQRGLGLPDALCALCLQCPSVFRLCPAHWVSLAASISVPLPFLPEKWARHSLPLCRALLEACLAAEGLPPREAPSGRHQSKGHWDSAVGAGPSSDFRWARALQAVFPPPLRPPLQFLQRSLLPSLQMPPGHCKQIEEGCFFLMHFLKFIYLFFLRERERGKERESQAGAALSAQSPTQGANPGTALDFKAAVGIRSTSGCLPQTAWSPCSPPQHTHTASEMPAPTSNRARPWSPAGADDQHHGEPRGCTEAGGGLDLEALGRWGGSRG